MQVEVLLFAVARQVAQSDVVKIELAGPATVSQLKRKLALKMPALARLIDASRIAMAGEFVDEMTIVEPRHEIALIPPVSGG